MINTRKLVSLGTVGGGVLLGDVVDGQLRQVMGKLPAGAVSVATAAVGYWASRKSGMLGNLGTGIAASVFANVISGLLPKGK